MLDLPASFEATFSSTHLPHKAVYITFTIISVGSLILGIGRSSMAMARGPLKTTAFIVSLAIVFPASYLGFLGFLEFSGFLGFWGRENVRVQRLRLAMFAWLFTAKNKYEVMAFGGQPFYPTPCAFPELFYPAI